MRQTRMHVSTINKHLENTYLVMHTLVTSKLEQRYF